MSELAQSDRTRLVKILCMLGSSHAGERDAAALAASRFLKTKCLTWADALTPQPIDRRLPERATWRMICARLMENPQALTPWERTFVAGLPKFQCISVKQRYVLNEIAQRVLGESR